MQRSSPLNREAIEKQLTTRSLGRRIHLHERLKSTNQEAVGLAQTGAEHGTLVLADAQTAGRGRMARTWFSPPGGNVYASVVVRTAAKGQDLATWLSWLPLMAALGAAEAIETVGSVTVAVKWPNDLLINDRKVGGILCESGTAPGAGPFQVVGIGINVNGGTQDFPEDFRETATTIRQETGHLIDRNRLVAQLLHDLESCLEEFLLKGAERVAQAYRRRCATIGKTVKAMLADGTTYIGMAQGIMEDASLLVVEPSADQHSAAAFRRLRAADIVHLR